MKYSAALAMAVAPLSMARFLDMLPGGELERRTHPEPEKQAWYPSGEEWQGMKGHGITKDSKTEIIIIWANPGNGAATTTINEKVTVTQTVTAGHGGATEAPAGEPAATAPAEPAKHTVTVGGPGGLVFQPEELDNVPIGDTVIFEFLAQNHTVSQSAFDTPCDLLEGGMDSGFMANPNNTVSPPPQVAMQVMVDTPLWFYCKQGNHCGQGMVFSINPTAEKTHAKFKEMAIQQKGTGEQAPITGGKPIEQPAAEKPAATEKPAAEKPAATETASAPENTGYVPGKGQIGSDGSCTCVVSCAAGSFPAANAQGVGAFGGMAGGLPMKMAGLS
ncbi:hypothetical protein CEP53_004158 [Fusarium sp. AF-6]|nr:hypothetical protein CEP53_004158 [Fusarium sp. AF-6]